LQSFVLSIRDWVTQQPYKEVAELSRYPRGLSVWYEDKKSFSSSVLEKQRLCLTWVFPGPQQECSPTLGAGRMEHGCSCSRESVCGHAGFLSPCCSSPARESQWPLGCFSRVWAGNRLSSCP